MSYNIGGCKTIGGSGLRIARRKAAKLRKLEWWPEDTFLDGADFDADGYASVEFCIRGECSGNCYQHHLDEIAAALVGDADVVLVWEDGGGITGLRIRDGKATEMDVEMRLVERAP